MSRPQHSLVISSLVWSNEKTSSRFDRWIDELLDRPVEIGISSQGTAAVVSYKYDDNMIQSRTQQTSNPADMLSVLLTIRGSRMSAPESYPLTKTPFTTGLRYTRDQVYIKT